MCSLMVHHFFCVHQTHKRQICPFPEGIQHANGFSKMDRPQTVHEMCLRRVLLNYHTSALWERVTMTINFARPNHCPIFCGVLWKHSGSQKHIQNQELRTSIQWDLGGFLLQLWQKFTFHVLCFKKCISQVGRKVCESFMPLHSIMIK